MEPRLEAQGSAPTQGVVIVLIRSMAASALTIAATCFPAAAADKGPSAEPAVCSALKGHDEELLQHLPRESIEDVSKLTESPLPPTPLRTEAVSENDETTHRGVMISVSPVEGLSVERLQRLVQCGLWRAAAADPARPTDWPRTPPGTKAEVYSGGDKFVVILRPRDEAAADALWRVAQELKPPNGHRRGSPSSTRGRSSSGRASRPRRA